MTTSAHEILGWIGWAVVHSLWQGALLGLVLWFCLSVTPRHAVRLRYRMALGGLLALFILNVGTFISYSLEADIANVVIGAGAADNMSAQLPLGGRDTGLEAQMSWWFSIRQWIDAHSIFIFCVWIVGVAFFTIKTGLQLAAVQYIRRSAVPDVPESWRRIWGRLSAEAKCRRPVVLMVSAIVDTPMLVGYLKPAVIFPVAAVNRLSIEEVEAILWHELMHLVQADHWWNLFTKIMETLYYYHPAVWFMAAQVRTEREHQCDRQVLGKGVPALTYAQALLRLQELRQGERSYLSVAAVGTKKSLLERVKRILGHHETTNHMKQRVSSLVLGMALVVSWAISTGFTGQQVLAEGQIEEGMGLVDTIPKRSGKVIFIEKSGVKYELEMREGQIEKARKDGHTVPAEELQALQERVGQITPPPAPGLFAGSPPPPPVPGMHPAPADGAVPPPPPPVMMPPVPTEGSIPPPPPPPPAIFPGGRKAPKPPARKYKSQHHDNDRAEIRWFFGDTLEVRHFPDKTHMKIVKGEGAAREILVIEKRKAGEDRHAAYELRKFSGQAHKGPFPEAYTYHLRKADDEIVEYELKLREALRNNQGAAQHLQIRENQIRRAVRENQRAMFQIQKELETAAAGHRAFAPKYKVVVEREFDEISPGMFPAPDRRHRRHDTKPRISSFEKTLLRNDYISDPADYNLKMNEKWIKVNGKKIKGKAYERLKKIYETETGQQLPGDFNVSIKKETSH